MESLKPTYEAKIAFDNLHDQYMMSSVDPGSADLKSGQIIFFDREGKQSESLDLRSLLSIEEEKNGTDEQTEENKVRMTTLTGDSLSILRFIRGNKSKRLEISPSGKNGFSDRPIDIFNISL